MKITRLVVENYRCLESVGLPVAEFTCLIGQNNSGKSSIMQALSLFKSGTKLQATDFFDQERPIRIAVNLSDITEQDLRRIESDEHRGRIANVCRDGNLELVRRYEGPGKRSELLVRQLRPKDTRFDPDH